MLFDVRPNRDEKQDIKFVGKKIRHEWIVGKKPKVTKWYNGKVIKTIKGLDGQPGTLYLVYYDDQDDGSDEDSRTYQVNHILEDYLEGSLEILE